MTARIDRGLLGRIKEALETEPNREIPVIVTVTSDADLAALVAGGLKIEREFKLINAVSGKLAAERVQGLAQLSSVQVIEFDGEVRALSDGDVGSQ